MTRLAGQPVHLVLLSDRFEALSATIRSAHASADAGTELHWHVFTSEGTVDAAKAANLRSSEGTITVASLNETVASLTRRGVEPVWEWPEWQTWLADAGGAPSRWRTDASLREFPSSRDPKHAHPLNLLRLYLAEVPVLHHLDRVLLIDDDVLFQVRLASLTQDLLTPADSRHRHHCLRFTLNRPREPSRDSHSLL